MSNEVGSDSTESQVTSLELVRSSLSPLLGEVTWSAEAETASIKAVPNMICMVNGELSCSEDLLKMIGRAHV